MGRTCGILPPDVDADADGYPEPIDCDDHDPDISSTARRSCASGCAVGFERCVDGIWYECDAPVDVDCCAGEVRFIPCGRCGSMQQDCSELGEWESGPCISEGVCPPGFVEGQNDACGACGLERVRRRICLETCEWDGWDAWGSCEATVGCHPGEVETESLQAGCETGCERRDRTRVCSGECAWGAWGGWGACRWICV
jgi:hypothetical protein